MKYLMFASIIFFACTACVNEPPPEIPLTTTEMLYQAKQSVVALGYYDAETDKFYPMGTGFVWDRSGHIVTNLHVVDAILSTYISVDVDRAQREGTNEINMTQPMLMIMFEDKRMFRTDLINFTQNDYEKAGPDIALLKIRKHDNFLIRATKKEIILDNEKTGTEIVNPSSFVTLHPFLHPIKYDPNHKSYVGDTVYAIGHPHGQLFTVTMGIISNIRSEMRNTSYIQTDASINPGNSGGILIDEQGYLIGMNTLILSEVGESNGLGFAITNHIIDYNVQKWLAIEEALQRSQERPLDDAQHIDTIQGTIR